MANVRRLLFILGIALCTSGILTCSDDGPIVPVVPMDTAFGVVSVTPIPGASEVPVDAVITITFSKPVRSTTVSTNSIVLEPPVDYTIECPAAARTAVIRPTDSLAFDQPYEIHILPSLISIYEDTLVGPREFAFRTMVDSVKIRPFNVTSITPTNGAQDVSANVSEIEIQFSKPVTCSTLTSSTVLLDPPVPFSIHCNAPDGLLKLYLSGGLGFDQQYTVNLTSGLRSTYDDSLPSASRTFSFHTASLPTNAVYVAAGASRVGTESSLYGTLQEGIDAAGSLVDGLVLVAAAEYDELVTILMPVTIRGNLDPSSGWGPHPTDSTVISGGVIEGHGVGLVVRDVAGVVRLTHLTIHAPDATSPGCGSYGLIGMNCGDISLTECELRSGQGGHGLDGVSGQNGLAGNAADGWPGQLYAPGGVGGSEYGDAQQGFCGDGSQTGGLPGCPGQTGPSGSPGTNGMGGSDLVFSLDDFPQYFVGVAGLDGTPGEDGCGGGGGNASVVITHTGGPETLPGSAGGGGGQHGSGGRGGTGGGSSIGLLLLSSNCSLQATLVTTKVAGRGGSGGTGGIGGSGGAGGPGANGCYLGEYTAGGDGGTGGDGGHGGGGAGGWSIGIALINGATLSGDAPQITLGAPGSGGTSPGNPGAVGQAAAVFTLPE